MPDLPPRIFIKIPEHVGQGWERLCSRMVAKAVSVPNLRSAQKILPASAESYLLQMASMAKTHQYR
jgi:hypothetical protein